MRGGEWGLVAPAVFKTVVSARKRRKVGSIPTRLRHVRGTPRYFCSSISRSTVGGFGAEDLGQENGVRALRARQSVSMAILVK